MAEKITLLQHLRSIALAAKDFTNELVGEVATATSEALEEMENSKQDKLPTVTSSDAGKFLRVSSTGTLVFESVPNAEEASF